MNKALKANKRILRSFMREQYSDEKLVQLLDHARAGKLDFACCCCFIGIVTATHPLRSWAGIIGAYNHEPHFIAARKIDGADDAELAYYRLANTEYRLANTEQTRRARLVPMILAELKRRRQLTETQPVPKSCWECTERIEEGVHDCPLRGVV